MRQWWVVYGAAEFVVIMHSFYLCYAEHIFVTVYIYISSSVLYFSVFFLLMGGGQGGFLYILNLQ